MFEDIVKERPDIREKLKNLFEEDINYIRTQLPEQKDNEEAVKFLADKLESEIDTFARLYFEEFSIPEIEALINWRTSDLGKRYTDFNVKKINPIMVEHMKALFEFVMEQEMQEMERIEIEQDEKEWEEVREEMRIRAEKLQKEREENEIKTRAWSTEEDVNELTSVTLKHKH